MMRQQKKVLLTLVFTALLASCGGGSDAPNIIPAPVPVPAPEPIKFTQMITFGDSLSDVGTYKVGAIAASKGGQFTVNSPTAKNWTEVLAAKYGLPAPCAAQTGFSSLIPGFPGDTTANISTCRNYAQGSARVTNLYGPSSKAIQDFVFTANGGADNAAAAAAAAAKAAGLGLTALPVFNQINNHLAVAPGGVFSSRELVVVLAGGNDVFLNAGAFGATVAYATNPSTANAQAAGGAAFFAGWDATQRAAAAAGNVPVAQGAAVQGMKTAGTELATYIKTLIVAKGAKFVAVVNLPDVGQTPLATNSGTTTAAFLTALSTTFNTAVAAGLAGVPEVTIVDALTQGRAQVLKPADFGLTNVTDPACAVGASATSGNPLGQDIDVPNGVTAPTGPSITCTPLSTLGIKAGTVPPIDVSRYNFADNVHLSPYGNQLLADFVYGRLSAAGFPK